jgi:putative transposase
VRLLGLARSTFYHRASAPDDNDLKAVLLEFAGQHPTYGYRRLAALLKRAGWEVNHKRIQRILEWVRNARSNGVKSAPPTASTAFGAIPTWSLT